MSLKTAPIDVFITKSDFRDKDTEETCQEGAPNCEVCNYCICWRAIFSYCAATALSTLFVGWLIWA